MSINPLQSAKKEILGGKGANLLRLQELGFRIPETYVVPADVFGDHRAAMLPQAIQSPPLHPDILRALTRVIDELGEGPLAIRSSASAEDGALASFAGQHETFLGVRGVEECSEAIRECWASLWNERSIAYRKKQGINLDTLTMSVLIQPLIPAEVSGVLFTRDPIQGEHVVIEAVPGLGERLVSGKVPPDRFVLDRQGTLLEQEIAPKAAALKVLPDGRVEEVPVEKQEKQEPCLSSEQLTELLRLGLEIERHFGRAQDIEWAIAQGEIILLQTRPITTGKQPTQYPLVWSNTNTGEVLPDVATPMTFSLVNHFVYQLFEPMLPRLSEIKQPVLGLIAGRAYFNLTLMTAILLSSPLSKKLNPHKLFGGLDGELPPIPRESLPEIPLGPWQAQLKNLAKALKGLLFPPSENPLETLRKERKGLEAIPPSDRALFAGVKGALGRVLYDQMLFPQTLLGVLGSEVLGVLCRKWLQDADGRISKTLFFGLGNLDSAEAGLSLWRLAQAAREQGIEETLLKANSFSELAEQIEGSPFLAAWEDFMAEHGHHARAELDVSVPRWRETPDYVLHQVKGLLSSLDSVRPAFQRPRTAEREALERECRAKLGPVRRRIFNSVLLGAQRGIAMRENLKSEMVRRMGIIRTLLLEAGARLVARGVLENRDEVFFFYLDELEDTLLRGTSGFSELIRARQAEFERNQKLTPPPVVVGDYHPTPVVSLTCPPADVLKGIAVSPGLATGRARVIARADQKQRVLPGEILVAPFTDPGWTPYFLPAAGIVMDQGGMLSHGSIVAREYGIPAVVNVGKATEWIQTGQWIQVDAYRGEVRLYSAEPPM